jgi:uncharacterized integral membrane protein
MAKIKKNKIKITKKKVSWLIIKILIIFLVKKLFILIASQRSTSNYSSFKRFEELPVF